jgi:hypothetical protein
MLHILIKRVFPRFLPSIVKLVYLKKPVWNAPTHTVEFIPVIGDMEAASTSIMAEAYQVCNCCTLV